MCPAPSVKKPTQFQAQKEPIRNPDMQSSAGRRGTILAPSGGGNVTEISTTGKKTALGQ